MKATITNRRGNPCPPNEVGPPKESYQWTREPCRVIPMTVPRPSDVTCELCHTSFMLTTLSSRCPLCGQTHGEPASDEAIEIIRDMACRRGELARLHSKDVDLEARRERYLANLEREHQARIKEESRRRAEALESAQEALENSKWKNVPVRLWRAWRDIFKEVLG